MSATSAPYGLLPINHQSGTVRTRRIPNGIASGLASNIFKGTPVKYVTATGTIAPVTASTDKIAGVFAGAEFCPVGGRPGEFNMWASGMTWDSTCNMFVYIWPADDLSIRWKIQADGAVLQAGLGLEYNLSNFAAGNTTTGLSAVTASATAVATGQQGQLVLQEFATDVGDAVGDAFTDLYVAIARNAIGGAPQVGL